MVGRVVAFTGERIHADDEDFRLDRSQHLAAYHACLPFVSGRVVLDAGCGDAGATSLLARSARVLVGIDNSSEALRDASRGRCLHVKLACGDVRALPFRDAAFDVVCSFQVLEHFPRPERFLRESVRVLRPGGRLVLTTPNRLTSFSENPYHSREYEPDELHELLDPSFSSVEILGLFGNERVQALQESRRRHVRAILALDPFGLRRALPDSVRKRAFAIFARWVRGRVRSEHHELFETSAVSDYEVRGDDVERALDLLAICEK